MPCVTSVFNKHTPDYVGARPELAELMIADSYKYIRLFVNKHYGKDIAQEVPPTALKSLILELAQSYHPIKTVNPSQSYMDVKGGPTQQEANGSLIKALLFDMKITLQSLHISTNWITELPSYSVPDTIDFSTIADMPDAKRRHILPYILPYDHPETLLSEVKTTRIELLITSQGLSN